jgi:hypothetical protein
LIAAVATGTAVLALIGLALGLVLALVVVILFSRVVSAAVEIDGYANDILDAGLGIARNLDGVDELTRTGELAGGVITPAGEYLELVKRRLG